MRQGRLLQQGNITTRAGTGAADGDDFSITIGAGGPTGNGGDLFLTAGAGGGTSGDGGDVNLTPGDQTGGLTGAINIVSAGNGAGETSDLRFLELTGTNYVGLKAPDSVATNVVWTLPSVNGTAGQVLSISSGSTLEWASTSVEGLDVKESVRAATTVNGVLATAYEDGDIIDGVTLVTGDRILLKNQTTGSANGIYTVNVSGAPTRATDFDQDSEVTANAFIFVEEGTTLADTGWVLSTDNPIIVGTTALVWVQFASNGVIQAGRGLTKTGNVLDFTNSSLTDIAVVDTDTIPFFDASNGDQAEFRSFANIIIDLDILVDPGAGVVVSDGTSLFARDVVASITAGEEGITVPEDGQTGDITIGFNITGLATAGSVSSTDSFVIFDGTNNVEATVSQVHAANPRIIRGTFTSATLTAGILTINHALNVTSVLVQIYDENDDLVQPNDITLSDNNNTAIDLTPDFSPITGTWKFIVFG